ncbi:hypothetical protein [Microbacterium sp. No. 7]|uniref:hypothetical protein n=1 Tax=Microbacterium sp. No. 7 TaxID=1714373 RepID=UPI000B00DC70|nr:hypothetical protein [Microbacterium sp. No. 7]
MTEDEEPGGEHGDEERPARRLPAFWSPDGQNVMPTTWKALLLLAVGAITVGALVSWLS